MRLYLVTAPSSGRIIAIKHVREALQVIDPEATARQAITLLERLDADGYALMAQGDPPTLARMTEVIERGGGRAVAVSEQSAERQERIWRSRKAKQEGATPEDVFQAEAPSEATAPPAAPTTFDPKVYNTAMFCVGICNGDPIPAALFASNLARTTEDTALWHSVIRCLAQVFPWIESPLRQGGAWPT